MVVHMYINNNSTLNVGWLVDGYAGDVRLRPMTSRDETPYRYSCD